MLDGLRDLFIAALVCHEDEVELLIMEWNEEIERIQKIFDRMTDKIPADK